ncbi:MAG: proton-conducting transporter membrane subunit [bacterium]|nr:proton-conducting transporter membrane subunit [bacterium]
MVIESSLPLFAIFIPLLGSIAIPILRGKIEKYVNQFTVLITVLTFAMVLLMYPDIGRGNILEKSFNSGFSIGFLFQVDALGYFIGFISAFIWMLTSFYSIEYMANKGNLLRYNMFSLLSLAGMLGVVFTGNLFSLYLAFELLTVASYVLIIQEENSKAMRAGMIYLFMGIAGGLILLFSILATYAMAGTGDFTGLASKLSGSPLLHSLLPYVFWGYIIGFGVKAGLFPFHVWVPEAYSITPSPSSALFAGVMKKAGAYGILRAIYSIVGMDLLRGETMLTVLLVFSLISIFLGSAIAISQTELKKMLAYSSIAQIGYIVLGFALLTPRGATGGTLHILNHALTKSTLFLAAGSFIFKKGIVNIADLEGIGKKMPVTTACFTIAGLSMIGFPPFCGFISKWFLALGSLDVVNYGSYSFYVGVIALSTLMLSSFMNLVYYGPVIYKAWFGGENSDNPSLEYAVTDEESKIEDPSLYMLIPLIILTAGIVCFGIFPQFPVSFVQKIVDGFFSAGGCIVK